MHHHYDDDDSSSYLPSTKNSGRLLGGIIVGWEKVPTDPEEPSKYLPPGYNIYSFRVAWFFGKIPKDHHEDPSPLVVAPLESSHYEEPTDVCLLSVDSFLQYSYYTPTGRHEIERWLRNPTRELTTTTTKAWHDDIGIGHPFERNAVCKNPMHPEKYHVLLFIQLIHPPPTKPLAATTTP